MNSFRSSIASLLALIVIAGVCPLSAFGRSDVSVRGQVRRDGTYVQPHWRSAPDSSYNNNWSTYPNFNPYTGKPGSRAPYLPDTRGRRPFAGEQTLGVLKT